MDALTQMLVKTAAEQHARIRGKQKAAQAISLHKREGWDLVKQAMCSKLPHGSADMAPKKKPKKATIVKEARAFGTYLAQRDRRRILATQDPDAAVSALHKTAAAGGLVKHASVDREELILRKIGEMFGR